MGGQQGAVNMAPSVGVRMAAPNPVTGNMPDPVPTNTPIPTNGGPPKIVNPNAPLYRNGFRQNTPQEAMAAMAQDDMGLPPSRSTLQAAQAALATQPPANGQATPTSLQAPAWLRYVQNGNAGITREAALAAAQQAEANGALPAGQAALLGQHPGGIDPTIAQTIRSHLGTDTPTPPDQPAIRSPQRYKLATDNYHSHVAAEVARLHQTGQTDAAHALLDIAVNKHSKADKQAARDALPPAMRSLIPDWVVNHGGN